VLSIDDPIAFLLHIATTICSDSMEVTWDDTVFGRKSNVPLYIYMMNLFEFSNGK